MPIIARTRLEKRLAELRQVFRSDADSGVGNNELQRIAFRHDVDADVAVFRRELHRVRDEVDEDLPAGALVGDDVVQSRRISAYDIDAGALGPELDHVAAGIGKCRQREALRRKFESARFYLRDVED